MKEIPRSELHSRFNLSGRDVRILVSNLNYPTILSREKAILVDVNVNYFHFPIIL
jgi:hypothetical protein